MPIEVTIVNRDVSFPFGKGLGWASVICVKFYHKQYSGPLYLSLRSKTWIKFLSGHPISLADVNTFHGLVISTTILMCVDTSFFESIWYQYFCCQNISDINILMVFFHQCHNGFLSDFESLALLLIINLGHT